MKVGDKVRILPNIYDVGVGDIDTVVQVDTHSKGYYCLYLKKHRFRFVGSEVKILDRLKKLERIL